MLLRGTIDRGLVVCSVSLAVACGARSRGDDPPAARGLDHVGSGLDSDGQLARRCNRDADCVADRCVRFSCVETFCVEFDRVVCADDPDPCVTLECQPASGQCEAENATPDEDGDGHFAARPGYAPGEALACGDDCDDTHASSHPSGVETCDGHDNDCDGSVDEGYSFSGPITDPVLVSEGAEEGGLGGLAHDGERFVLSYAGRSERNESMLAGLRSDGEIDYRTAVALTNSDTYPGPVHWNGSRLTTAWEDRRDEDFEIYWNRFDAEGRKLAPDLRLSVAEDFSLNPSMVLVGERQLVVWQDRRDAALNFQIYAQWIDERGQLEGDNLNLSSAFVDAEDPAIGFGREGLALAFNTEIEGRQVVFQPFDFELGPSAPPVVISGPHAVGASLSYAAGRFVALWHEYDGYPGDAIWGAIVDPVGALLVEPRRVTEPAEFARGHDVIVLGDRLLLLFTQYTEGSYDVFLRELDTDLDPLGDARRITSTPGDVLGSTMAIGPEALGVAYMDYSAGPPQVYFLTVTCE